MPNLTQHIEDGFVVVHITCAAFIYLTAAYESAMIPSIAGGSRLNVMPTDDVLLTKFIRTMLSNQQSRWRKQRNGLPQGSVLSPLLFNVYTNDQPLPVATNSLIYADDMCLTTQQNTFEQADISFASGL